MHVFYSLSLNYPENIRRSLFLSFKKNSTLRYIKALFLKSY